MICVEGMGVLGCVIAARLEQEGFEWCWCDNNDEFTAWKASTGCVSLDDLSAYNAWKHLPGIEQFSVLGRIWVNHKTPPWRNTAYDMSVGGVSRTREELRFIDIPQFVLGVRELYKHMRVESPTGLKVLAHSRQTANGYWWGWSARAQISGFPAGEGLYTRTQRFFVDYAYPMPDGSWKLGSTMTRQTIPKPLNVDNKINAWVRRVVGYFPDLTLKEIDPILHGWRPLPASDISPQCRKLEDGSIQTPAMGADGVRLAPLVANSVIRMLP